jgi:hypothetical protein
MIISIKSREWSWILTSEAMGSLNRSDGLHLVPVGIVFQSPHQLCCAVPSRLGAEVTLDRFLNPGR